MKRIATHVTDKRAVRLVTANDDYAGRCIKNVAQIDAVTGYSLPIKAESDATSDAMNRA